VSAPLPPPDLASRTPQLVMVPAGSVMHRFYTAKAKYDPIFFDSSREGRLNSLDGSYGVLYAAREPAGAFAETFLRTPGRTLIDMDRLRRKTPSAHTYTYRRADRSRFCQRSYSLCHSAVSLQTTAGERFGASLPRSAASASWKSPVEMPRR
jgi:RES domain